MEPPHSPTAKPLRFGVTLAPEQSAAAWREKVRRFEDSPIDVLLVNDHLSGLRYAPLIALTSAAELTRRVRLGILVLANDFRHPAILAKEISTLDLLSGGRVELGIGTGWLRSDYDRAGLVFDEPPVRIARLQEAVRLLQGAWSDTPFSFSGRYYRAEELDLSPRPTQRPHPPLLIGGGGPSMLKYAARHADIVNVTTRTSADGRGVDPSDVGLAALLDKLAMIKAHAEARPATPEISVGVRGTVINGAVGDLHSAVAQHRDQLAGTPYLLSGSPTQIAQEVLKWYLEHEISYFIFGNESDATAMIPIISSVRDQIR